MNGSSKEDPNALVVDCTKRLDGTDIDQYDEADKYWSSVDASIDGMLGGFAAISPADLEGSGKLLKLLFKVRF